MMQRPSYVPSLTWPFIASRFIQKADTHTELQITDIPISFAGWVSHLYSFFSRCRGPLALLS